MRSISSRLFAMIPRRSPFLLRICKKYLDRYNNDNNNDMASNGELRLLGVVLKQSVTVFDVGSNVGNWAKLILDIKPEIFLHCFEPGKDAFQKLMNNKFPDNVICNNLGIGSKEEKRTLHVYKDRTSMSTLYDRRGIDFESTRTEQSVGLTTIDSYCKDKSISNIDYLKIDVEGHELEVLKGAFSMLKRKKIAMVQFEYGGCFIDAHMLLKDIFEYLDGFHYSIFKIMPDHLQLYSKYNQKLENFQHSNYVAIDPDSLSMIENYRIVE